MEIARRHGCVVNYKPVALGTVFAQTGGLPLAQRHPARQRYRLLELQRWREKRGVSFQLHPRHWPFDAKLADRVVIALVAAGADPDPFMRRVFDGVWRQERDLGDAQVLSELAAVDGHDAAALLKAARGDMTEAVYAINLENAIGADVFGSPAYVLDGEAFWGQDRLDLLDDALQSGRAPYRAQP
jgi:2-hydroxychromene-2-carboxylate isomerase